MAVLALCMLLPIAATAQTQIAQQSIIITDDQGAFSVQKTATVFDDGGGIFRYVYVVESLAGDPICGFKLLIPSSDVLSASWNTGTGVDPQSVSVDPGQTEWRFGDATSPFTCLAIFGAPFPGAVSSELVITSTKAPGMVGDFITVSLNSLGAFDEPGQCLGPVAALMAGDPFPCTIGFWKARSEGKKGTLQYFADDPDLMVLSDAAAALSSGLFMGGADLLAALQKQGNRSDADRAEQQYAAFLLDLAAGGLFQDNGKCQLFGGNLLDGSVCGGAMDVAAAQAYIDANIASGNHEAAKDCADDINNGIGVIDTQGGS
jgi:hypothetical protein